MRRNFMPMARTRKRVVLFGLIIGSVGILLTSGCVFAAVRAVRYVEHKINPPQPLLQDAAVCLNGSLRIGAVLRSTEGRRLGRMMLEDESADDVAKDKDEPKPRMALVVILTNTGKSTAEFTLVSLESPLGKDLSAPKTVALAAGQRFFLGPFRSAREDNFGSLAVTVTVRQGTKEDTHVLNLTPLADDTAQIVPRA